MSSAHLVHLAQLEDDGVLRDALLCDNTQPVLSLQQRQLPHTPGLDGVLPARMAAARHTMKVGSNNGRRQGRGERGMWTNKCGTQAGYT